jgi:pantoate kinase
MRQWTDVIASQLSTRRGFASVAILAITLAQLGASIHAANVRHVRCAEHGDLVEAPELAAHASDRSRLVAVESETGDGDVHCTIASGLRTRITPDHPQLDEVACVTTDVAIAVPRARVALVALYRIAPKTSPPDLG